MAGEMGATRTAEPRVGVGDLVVYASHGVGRVSSRLDDTVTLEFDGGLSVTLPVSRAVECVRPLSTEAQLADVGRLLGEPEIVSKENWQRRLKATRLKVAGGEVASLAEVVRDASRREGQAGAQKELSRLSLTERQLYMTARQRLADEIGASRGVDSPAADAWIGEQLGWARPAPSAAESADAALSASGSRARRRRR